MEVSGSRIILLTDGKENEDPRVNVVKPEILAKGIIVDTILLTQNAGVTAPVLISLAADTGNTYLQFIYSGTKHPMAQNSHSFKLYNRAFPKLNQRKISEYFSL